MKRYRLGALATAGFLLAGCSNRQPDYRENSRVDVRAPFVNVNVPDQGGVRVRAPFTDVDTTSRYQSATSGNGAAGGPSPRFQPTGTIAPYNPMPSQNSFQPTGAIWTPSGTSTIPPAAANRR